MAAPDNKVPNDRNHQRAMLDRAGRDEAGWLRVQKAAAGGVHGPVHAQPPLGEPSPTPHSVGATADLAQAYVRALEAERAAWQRVTGLPPDASFDAVAWNSWRTAVEERDLATRVLINYALSASPR